MCELNLAPNFIYFFCIIKTKTIMNDLNFNLIHLYKCRFKILKSSRHNRRQKKKKLIFNYEIKIKINYISMQVQ